MTLKEPRQAIKPDPARAPAVSAASKDRRRPDRPNQISPHLLPLLRTSEIGDAAASGTADGLLFDDGLAPAKGIAVGLLLSVPLWAVIGGIVWAVL
jgi:hypothetical protein